MNGLARKLAGNAILMNSVFLGLSGAARGLAEVALVVLAIRVLGPSTGGQLIFGFAIIRVAQYIAEGGLGMYLTREIPRNPSLTGTYTLEALKLVLVLAGPVGVFAAIATGPFQPEMGLAIAFATVAVIFGAAQPILGAAFLAHDRTHLMFKNMVVMAVTLVGGGLLVAIFLPTLLAFFFVIAVSRAAAFAVGFLDFLKHFTPTIRLANLSARRAFACGFPYGLNALGSYLYLRVDIVLLGAISGSLATGIYGSVADPMVSLTAFVYVVTRAFLPSLSKDFAVEPRRFQGLVRRMLLLNLALGGVLSATVFLGSGPFVSLAFGDQLAPAATVLRVLSAAIVLRFFNSGLATWLTASGRQWHRASAILGAAGFNIVVNLIAIPVWGYWAAAWSTVATEVVLLGVFLWLLRPRISTSPVTTVREAFALASLERRNANQE